jgi:hypothetical protein
VVVSRRPRYSKACVQSQATLCGICGGQSGTVGSFLPVLQFSPVSIIPPMLHTHLFIYHRCCIMFLSQYFSFPLSVSFHQCSILTHLSPKLQNLRNWQCRSIAHTYNNTHSNIATYKDVFDKHTTDGVIVDYYLQ